MLPVKQVSGLSIGATEPPRVNGAMWLETNASGVPLHGWIWSWDGARWLSPEQQWITNFSAQSVASNQYFSFHRRVRIRAYSLDIFINPAQNASNNWQLTLSQIDRVNNKLSPSSISTSTFGSNQWATFGSLYSFTIDPNASPNVRRLELLLAPIGSPGITFGTGTIRYYFER